MIPPLYLPALISARERKRKKTFRLILFSIPSFTFATPRRKELEFPLSLGFYYLALGGLNKACNEARARAYYEYNLRQKDLSQMHES